MTTALPFWHDMPELQGEVPPLTADDLHRIALRQTYSLAYWLDRDDEARTDHLLAESVQLDLARLTGRLSDTGEYDDEQYAELVAYDEQMADEWMESPAARDYLASTEE